ncbi:hypothetical protein JW711_02310 [Candidatus Woesearchaeota archaeon]|nr:hypothetical protein [Candidatus Woesearchaeota archaeon]
MDANDLEKRISYLKGELDATITIPAEEEFQEVAVTKKMGGGCCFEKDIEYEHRLVTITPERTESDPTRVEPARKELEMLVQEYGLTHPDMFAKTHHITITNMLVERLQEAGPEKQLDEVARLAGTYGMYIPSELVEKLKDADLEKFLKLARFAMKYDRDIKGTLVERLKNEDSKKLLELARSHSYPKFLRAELAEHYMKATQRENERAKGFLEWARDRSHRGDEFDALMELSVIDEASHFDMAMEYARGKNPAVRRIGLIVLARIGEERCYEPLIAHFSEMLEEDSRVLERQYPLSERNRIERYGGIVQSLLRINPAKAHEFLLERLCEALDTPEPDDEKQAQGFRIRLGLVAEGLRTEDQRTVSTLLQYSAKVDNYHGFSFSQISHFLGDIKYREVTKGDEHYEDVMRAMYALEPLVQFSHWGDGVNELLVDLLDHQEISFGIEAATLLLDNRYDNERVIDVSGYEVAGKREANYAIGFYKRLKQQHPRMASQLIERNHALLGLGQLRTTEAREFLFDVYKIHSSEWQRKYAIRELGHNPLYFLRKHYERLVSRIKKS